MISLYDGKIQVDTEKTQKWIDLEKTKSIEEAIAFSRGMARKLQLKDEQWIPCFAWNEQNWIEKRFLNRDDLDRISTKQPVIAIRECGNVVAVNTRALEKLDFLNSDPDDGKVEIERDAKGRPTGILKDALKPTENLE